MDIIDIIIKTKVGLKVRTRTISVRTIYFTKSWFSCLDGVGVMGM